MKLVKMIRGDGREADVHPGMVADYRKGGYVEAKDDAEESQPIRKGRKK